MSKRFKAWGASPRIESHTISEPAKRAIAGTIDVNRNEPAVAHYAGLNTFNDTSWGSASLHPRLMLTPAPRVMSPQSSNRTQCVYELHDVVRRGINRRGYANAIAGSGAGAPDRQHTEFFGQLPDD